MNIFRFRRNKGKEKPEGSVTEAQTNEELAENTDEAEVSGDTKVIDFSKDKNEEPDNTDGQDDGEEPRDSEEAAYDSSPILSDSSMEEIYSTKDKHVKYRRMQPLEAEAAAKRTAASKVDLKRGKLEFRSSDEENTPEVKLEAEIDPNAIVADEIIEDVVDVKKLRNIYVQDIDEIDVSLDPMDSVKEYERRANDKQRHDARTASGRDGDNYVPSGDTIVAKVPVYQHASRIDQIYLKAGRFTDVVESEYDEYLKSTDPSISKNYHAMQSSLKPHQSLLYTLSQVAARHKAEAEQRQKRRDVMRKNFDEDADKPTPQAGPQPQSEPVPEPEPEAKQKKDRKPSKVGRFFSKFFKVFTASVSAGWNKPTRAEQERALDYNSREDEKYISERTNKNLRRLAVSLAVYALISIVMISLVIWERTSGAAAVIENGTRIALIYCAVNLILTLAMGVVARHTVIDGLKPLRRFKANSSTMIALAYLASLLQLIVAMFTSESFVGADHHLYCFIIAFALLLDNAGRLMMVMRVKSNFEFISSHSPAYAAKIYNDEETARRLVSGTTASKGLVAYQHVTRFLSDYLKISYAPDPSEELSGKMSPVGYISAFFVTVLYAILFKSVQGTVSAMTVMLCIGIPFTAMIAGNLPMLIFSRRMLDEEAMVAGYPSVRQFCDTSAVLLSAADLFPSGCVNIENLVPLQQYRVEENLLMAAAVLREAMSPIAPVFDELVMEYKGELPSVESVMYEDKSGLVGWIGGERVLIGNLKLMNRYHITITEDIPVQQEKKKGNFITYIAVSGQAVAVLALSYTAAPITKEQIRIAERSGLALVVSTTDANITDDLIADRYGLFHRSVKVTAPGYSNVIEEETTKVEEASRAYLATRGKIGSLARAIGGCIGVKSNISLGIAIEIFGMILGILLCATLALYASVARLSVVELIIYIGFWVCATVIAELIRRP